MSVSPTIIISPVSFDRPTTLVDLFDNIADAPWSLLFDTAGSSASNGRYNLMMWSPLFSCVSEKGVVSVTDHQRGTSKLHHDLPFECVKQQFEAVFANAQLTEQSKPYSHLPFITGVAGLAGYDLGRSYEPLPDNAINDYACPDMAIGIYPQSLIEDTHSGIIYHCRLSGIPEFSGFEHQSHTPFNLTSDWQSNLSQEQYTHALDKIHKYLCAGDCYQVNMAQRFSADYCGSEWNAFLHLRNQNQAPFSAYMKLEKSAIISISPERFLSVKDGHVETKPIKGTRPRSPDTEVDNASADALLASEKDRAENLMIVDLLRNDLSKHCQPGSVDVPHLFALESYAAVHHMVSTVVGNLNVDASPLDLLAGAFPGGSITGAPKVRAMEIIDELEPHCRNIYCGSMLYMGFRQDMDSSICIRTLLAENGHIYCWAGGGIVLDSDAQEEYQETLDKVARILPELDKLRD